MKLLPIPSCLSIVRHDGMGEWKRPHSKSKDQSKAKNSPLAFAVPMKEVKALPSLAKGAGESFFGYFFCGKTCEACLNA
ncbi:MAG TPA: hypothetical protein VF273_03105 [Pelobium sp.]